jgi:hypothetical protein
VFGFRYTITKNMSSDRFASLDEHELQKITEAGDSDNTKNVTTWIGFGYQIPSAVIGLLKGCIYLWSMYKVL